MAIERGAYSGNRAGVSKDGQLVGYIEREEFPAGWFIYSAHNTDDKQVYCGNRESDAISAIDAES